MLKINNLIRKLIELGWENNIILRMKWRKGVWKVPKMKIVMNPPPKWMCKLRKLQYYFKGEILLITELILVKLKLSAVLIHRENKSSYCQKKNTGKGREWKRKEPGTKRMRNQIWNRIDLVNVFRWTEHVLIFFPIFFSSILLIGL